MKDGRILRLGAGSAHEGDDLDAARMIAESGAVEYIVFDCTSEKAFSMAYMRKQNGLPCYDIQLEPKLRAVLPGCAKNGVTMIANAGALDPEGAAHLTVEVARDLGLKGLRIAYVAGADVSDVVRLRNPIVRETGRPVSDLGNEFLGALAYGGGDQIVEALKAGADIVLTSRAGDSEQFLAPMAHEFDWAPDDWDKIGSGLGIGHLMECAAQVSGGFLADPGRKEVSGLHQLGFPIAEVEPDGAAVLTKLPGTGGVISEQSVKEQLLYEIGDPANYVHAPGVVDFTTTTVKQVGPDRVRVEGTTGHPKTPTARVALAVREGWVGMGRITYGGTGCYRRAKLAAETAERQLVERFGAKREDLRFDYIGYNALFDWGVDPDKLMEIELRVTGRFLTRDEARKVQMLVSQLPVSGPSGGAWGRPLDQGGVEEIVTFYSALLATDDIHYEVHTLVS
ncbi:MAG: acyclic terpene utilization AtuA family protein [Beijerinckiaceae bacterium]